MPKIDSAFFDIGYLDTLSYQDTPIHRLDPRSKLIVTLVFIVTIVSCDRYEISGLLGFFIFPVVMIARGNLPVGYLLKKLLMVAPFAFFVGVFNPLFDREIVISFQAFDISGGWLSFFSILLRFTLTVSAALILIATSGFPRVCLALEKLKAPRVFAVQLLFLYRYIFVLTGEALRLVRARALRTFDGKGGGVRVAGSMIGHLLLRTMSRARRIHLAMLCRGFDGEIRTLRPLHATGRDVGFVIFWLAVFILLRLYDLTEAVSLLLVGGIG